MAILFKTVRWQNFLSTGNRFTEIRLDRSRSTLILGENGAGKSTILDAISFALYGRAFRNINKPQLLNSITQKNCIVEIEFSIGTNEYKVIRGLKPNVFEIYQNDSLVDQTANSREYQDILEKSILKLSFKSFGQVVVLGSASFIPFMQLSAADRRHVIEDLLDIQVFSQMNVLLKERLSENKTTFMQVENHINNIGEKIEIYLQNMQEVSKNVEMAIEEKRAAIDTHLDKVGILARERGEAIEQRDTRLASISHKDKNKKRVDDINALTREMKSKINVFQKELEFYSNNAVCTVCDQGIDETLRNERIEKCKKKIASYTDALGGLAEQLDTALSIARQINSVELMIAEDNERINVATQEISRLDTVIKLLREDIEKLSKTEESLSGSIDDSMESLQKEKQSSMATRASLIEQRSLLDVGAVLLKDTGIKTQIIKQYIPIMNTMINKYLSAMDFFVSFELNENFVETIKSRHRDDFTYASFSEGEKMRIDLALLFTWRAISKLRNSVSTNLLIMDEVFDSSLDAAGTEEFLKIIQTINDGTNIFVISHKGDALYDKFHSVIRFEKHKNFSRIS